MIARTLDLDARSALDELEEALDQPLEGAEPSPQTGRSVLLRLGLLATMIAGLIVAGVQSGLASELSAESIRAQVANAGALGWLTYAAIFTGGQMLHLPGIIFIGGGAVAWGAGLGGVFALLAGVFAVSVNFLFVRIVGGQPMGALKNRWAKKAIDLLDERPVTAVILLRLIFFTSPAMSTALALSNVRFRDHLVGSFVGMTPAIFVCAYFIDLFL